VTHSNSIRSLVARSFTSLALVAGVLATGSAQASVPGITGGASTATTVSFNLSAYSGLTSQPDGTQIYTWGYGCGVGSSSTAATPGIAPVTSGPAGFLPANFSVTQTCGLMQLPGPTLIVTEGQVVTVNLYNGLPQVAGNTSIVFSGFATSANGGGVQGQVTQEAAPGTTISYTFTAGNPGTYAYYSGTRPELQIDMGLYGAIVVLPKTAAATCSADNPTLRGLSKGAVGGIDYRNSTSAMDHPETCYDREFLFQFSEMDGNIHQAVQACVNAGIAACPQIDVVTDPYHPNYYVLNGRSFPDDMDPNFAPMYPNQPYNGDPQMHPGETMLLRVVGQGRMQHPFHIHANHGRVLARDGNMLLAANDPLATATNPARLAGPLYYTVPTVPGQGQDLIFMYTAKGLNWDMYGHGLNVKPPLPIGPTASGNPANDPYPCYPDSNGFYTANSSPVALPTAANYYEWCADHNKPIPITPPDPQIVANGLWYGGTPYMGLAQIPIGGGAPQFLSTPLPPGTTIQNPSAGYAFMWHSHAERELTTNNVFPGGMLMMLVIQPPSTPIDETN
jgi:FtsP/CotA-like multicopper oxidase with cupredoxin domain